MAIYFVDYTSTGEHGLNGIDELDTNDTVYIFYDFFNNTLPMKQLKLICECTAKLKLIDLGFSTIFGSAREGIATHLNYEVGKDDTTEAFVITERAIPFNLAGPLGNIRYAPSIEYLLRHINDIDEDPDDLPV